VVAIAVANPIIKNTRIKSCPCSTAARQCS
jgi:hypothetical protein